MFPRDTGQPDSRDQPLVTGLDHRGELTVEQLAVDFGCGAGIVGVIAFAPIAVLTWDVDAAAIPYIAASAALELGYFAFLAAGYRMSEVSLIYPVARGAAPILVLVGAVLFLHRGTTAGQVAGVIAVGTLIAYAVRVARDRQGSSGRAR